MLRLGHTIDKPDVRLPGTLISDVYRMCDEHPGVGRRRDAEPDGQVERL